MTEDEMVGWHRRLSGQDSEQDPEDGERQGSLPCCSPRGHKTSDMSERLNDNNPPNDSEQTKGKDTSPLCSPRTGFRPDQSGALVTLMEG